MLNSEIYVVHRSHSTEVKHCVISLVTGSCYFILLFYPKSYNAFFEVSIPGVAVFR